MSEKPDDRELRGENIASVKRRGRRRSAGQDTPSGPRTDRTVKPAKQEQEREAAKRPENGAS
jgi:hypothetical protein